MDKKIDYDKLWKEFEPILEETLGECRTDFEILVAHVFGAGYAEGIKDQRRTDETEAPTYIEVWKSVRPLLDSVLEECCLNFKYAASRIHDEILDEGYGLGYQDCKEELNMRGDSDDE